MQPHQCGTLSGGGAHVVVIVNLCQVPIRLPHCADLAILPSLGLPRGYELVNIETQDGLNLPGPVGVLSGHDSDGVRGGVPEEFSPSAQRSR